MLLLLVIMPLNIYAYSSYIYAGGETVGIKVNSTGILVIGTYEVDKTNKVSLQVGDIIKTIDNRNIKSSTDFIEAIKGKSVVSVGYIRGNKEYKTTITTAGKVPMPKIGIMKPNSAIDGIACIIFITPIIGFPSFFI